MRCVAYGHLARLTKLSKAILARRDRRQYKSYGKVGQQRQEVLSAALKRRLARRAALWCTTHGWAALIRPRALHRKILSRYVLGILPGIHRITVCAIRA